jgi:dTDP-4-amino-4,6-dideoxygalactose transaminase
VSRPRLPSRTDLLPYLPAIDKRCWYSNYGPFATQLEQQITRYLGMAEPGVVTTANATVGLTATLLARKVAAGSLCVMPSWTFAATPHAARAAGVTPGFHDVDRRYWTLNPEGVLKTLKHISRPVGAVMVVSPFGAPIDIQAWECFEDRTGIPVVVDAAAGFDTARVSRIPLVVSCMRPKFWERARAASSPPRTRSCWTACGCAATSASKTRAWRCCHHSMPK